jgi:hypothetical protein
LDFDDGVSNCLLALLACLLACLFACLFASLPSCLFALHSLLALQACPAFPACRACSVCPACPAWPCLLFTWGGKRWGREGRYSRYTLNQHACDLSTTFVSPFYVCIMILFLCRLEKLYGIVLHYSFWFRLASLFPLSVQLSVVLLCLSAVPFCIPACLPISCMNRHVFLSPRPHTGQFTLFLSLPRRAGVSVLV